jgi:hypothetical protein
VTKINSFTTKRNNSTRLVLWVLAVCFFATGFVLPHDRVSRTLTFCPLQNRWVERSAPTPRPLFDLANICSAVAQKDRFTAIAVARDNSVDEYSFFSFAVIGNRAFEALPHRPSVPQQSFIASERIAAGIGKHRKYDAILRPAGLTIRAFETAVYPTLFPQTDPLPVYTRGFSAFSDPRGPPVLSL